MSVEKVIELLDKELAKRVAHDKRFVLSRFVLDKEGEVFSITPVLPSGEKGSPTILRIEVINKRGSDEITIFTVSTDKSNRWFPRKNDGIPRVQDAVNWAYSQSLAEHNVLHEKIQKEVHRPAMYKELKEELAADKTHAGRFHELGLDVARIADDTYLIRMRDNTFSLSETKMLIRLLEKKKGWIE